MTTQPYRFVLQARHPEYGCPAFETMFTVEVLDDLRAILGECADDDPKLDIKFYHMDLAELPNICRKFGVSFDPGGRKTILYKDKPDPTPFFWHAGYELALMVDRRKPFVRIDYVPYPPHQHVDEELYDRFVAEGLLHKEVELEPFGESMDVGHGRLADGYRMVTYTLKGEEWRIPAWAMMKKAYAKSGWTETVERLELMLQGYEDWQIDWHLEQLRQCKVIYGTFLVYVAVDAATLAAVDRLGCRALPPSMGPLKLVSTSREEPGDQEHLRLLEADGAVALLRLRVKARTFLDLVTEKQERFHDLPADRIEDLNRTILEPLEIVRRR